MALQLRRGTNAERLAMTPVNGELIFVTDYELVTLSVTAIDTGTDTLTSVDHGLAVDQQIKFQDASLNGLVLDQVYFVKTVPTSDTFTLSLTSGGATVNITGTFTIPLIFAVTPTDAAGTPLGEGAAILWIGDGATVGGVVASAINLDDLLDVVITEPVTEGEFLWYDGTNWINTNETTVEPFENTLSLTRRYTSAVASFESSPALRLNGRVTDVTNDNTDDAGPALRFERSSGTQLTKTYVSGGAIAAFTVTLNNVTGLVVGNKVTGTGLPAGNGALITVIAGNQITLDTAFTVQAAGTYTIGEAVAFGQLTFDYFGTTDVHRFRVLSTTDNFLENPANTYPGTDTLIDSTKNATSINEGVLYVDAVNDRVGINDTSPSYTLDVNGTANIETSLTVPSISTLTGDDLTITAFAGRDVTISTTTATDPVTIVRTSTQTGSTDTVRTLTLRADSTGTPVIGFGNNLEFETESTPGTFVQSAYIENKSTGDNAGVLDEFNMAFGVMSAGVSTERMVLDNLGNLQIDGDLTVTGNDIKSSSATAITLSGANVTVIGDLAVNGGDITTTQTTGNLFNATATTVNVGNGATTEVNLGNTGSGQVQIKSPTIVGANTTQAVFNTVATTVNAFGASTATAIGSTASGTTTIGYDLVVNNDLTASQLTIDTAATINTQTTTTTTTSPPTSISSTTRTTQKVVINIVDTVTGEIHVLEALAFQKGATAYLTTYAEIYSSAALATFTADVSGGAIRILATPGSTNSTIFKVVRIGLD